MLQIPDWNYDGSSTGQAEGFDSEIMLKPVKLFLYDPFRSGCDLLAWCETYFPNGEPTLSNKRPYASKIFDQHLNLEPWYGNRTRIFYY